MKFYSNQDAFGRIVLFLSFFAFVLCGTREEFRDGAPRSQVRAPGFESSQTPTFGAFPSPRFDVAFAFDSEISAFLRFSPRRSFSKWTSRRLRLFSCSTRVFKTLANRLTFEHTGRRLFQVRPFWASVFPSLPLFLSFLTLRN